MSKGLLKVASSSFLISISRREQVALIRGKPVYSISEVALIPLSSQPDAEEAIIRARSSQQRHSQSNEDFLSDSSDDETITLPDDASVPDPDLIPNAASSKLGEAKDKATSIAEDVIARRGVYGRFTDRWFSNKGWTAEQRRKQGLSVEDDLQRIKSAVKDPASLFKNEGPQDDSSTPETGDSKTDGSQDQVAPIEVAHVVEATKEVPLLPKVLTTTKIFFGSKNFFFSYDYDLSRNVARQIDPSASQSLHRTFDPSVSLKHTIYLALVGLFFGLCSVTNLSLQCRSRRRSIAILLVEQR